MLDVCSNSPRHSCAHPMIWVSIVLWAASAFGSTFGWMRLLFARYEVTVALPIEYGALNFANVMTGLVFMKVG